MASDGQKKDVKVTFQIPFLIHRGARNPQKNANLLFIENFSSNNNKLLQKNLYISTFEFCKIIFLYIIKFKKMCGQISLIQYLIIRDNVNNNKLNIRSCLRDGIQLDLHRNK